jgi:hypothetical protein
MEGKKYKSWWKYMSFLVEASPPLQSRYPIIDKNILSYKLVEHHFYPFLQKELIKNVVKGSESRELAAYIYCRNFINYCFYH